MPWNSSRKPGGDDAGAPLRVIAGEIDEVGDLRGRGLEDVVVRCGGLEVNAGAGVGNAVPNPLDSCIVGGEEEDAEEVVLMRFGKGVDNAVPNLLGSGIEEDEETGVGNAVSPDPLDVARHSGTDPSCFAVGFDNAGPNLLGDMEGAMESPWPERGPRLVELPIGVERERGDELDPIGNHELNEQDGELF